MKVSIRQIADVTILDLSGRLVAGETEPFRSSLRDLIARGETNIILNLAQVPYIDSAGIGELVQALVATRRDSGDLKLLHPVERVSEVLETVKLSTVFHVFENERDALAAFAAPLNDDGDDANAAMHMEARAS